MSSCVGCRASCAAGKGQHRGDAEPSPSRLCQLCLYPSPITTNVLSSGHSQNSSLASSQPQTAAHPCGLRVIIFSMKGCRNKCYNFIFNFTQLGAKLPSSPGGQMCLCLTNGLQLVGGCVSWYFFIIHVIFSSILFLKTERSGSVELQHNELVMHNNISACLMKTYFRRLDSS